jgi:outer membrane protein
MALIKIFINLVEMTSYNFKTALILAAVLFISGTAFSQTLTLSLKEAQDFAVKNSYDVKNAQFDLDIARKKVKENLSYGFPQIDGTVDYLYYIGLPTSLIPAEFTGGEPGEFVELQFGTKNNLTAGVTLNQLIFDGRYFIGLEYAKIYEQLSIESLEKSEEDVKEAVTQTYYNILVGEAALKVLDSTLVVLEKTRFETGEMFKEGFAEQTDYDQLTLTVTDIRNSINSLNRQNEIGYKLLNYQMGVELEKQVVLTETLDALIEQAGISALLDQKFNLEQHVDYRLITSQEHMKSLSLRNEKAAYYPTLNGFIFVQENAQRNEFDFTDPDEPWFMTSATGVSLVVPIMSSGYRKSRVSQARIDLEKIRNTKNQVTEGLELSIAQSRSEFRTAMENVMREKENVDLSLEIYKKTLTKYNEGLASSVELTQQHNQFFDSERKYFQTVLTLLAAKNKLDKDLGNY